ncbi:MAG: hypothetical protein HKN74_13960 [Acidimicrobiia bacterium]|nr:hypothetical protein [Acidimicrobiia bacterium]
MRQSLKIGFVTLVVAAVAAGGMAFAQSNGTDDTIPPVEDGQVQEAPDVEENDGAEAFEGRRHRAKHRSGARVDQVAEILGIDDPQEILDALDAGDTLADVAAANGSSGDALVTELVTGLEEKLADAVADERIDQDRADEILSEATDRITTLVNSTQEEIQAAREAAQAERQAEREARQVERQELLSDVIGIPFEDIQAALEDGETTLAEVAAEQGVELDELVDGLVAPAAADLAEKVADGTLTQEEADEKLAEITERITERVQTVRSDRPGRGHRGHSRGGPGFGGSSDEAPAAEVGLNA